MSNSKTRAFEGTVDSANPAFHGVSVPATLTLIEHDHAYECRFSFVLGAPIPFNLFVPKTSGNRLEGTAKDPRGWDVSFTAELNGNRVTGTYHQPHDQGTFDLTEV